MHTSSAFIDKYCAAITLTPSQSLTDCNVTTVLIGLGYRVRFVVFYNFFLLYCDFPQMKMDGNKIPLMALSAEVHQSVYSDLFPSVCIASSL